MSLHIVLENKQKVLNKFTLGNLGTNRLYTPGPGQYTPSLNVKRSMPKWKYIK